MLKTQMNSDKVAVTLSAACVIHCFFAPSFIILTSGILSISIDNELVHYLILLAAVPVSVFALYLGYKNHKNIPKSPRKYFPSTVWNCAEAESRLCKQSASSLEG